MSIAERYVELATRLAERPYSRAGHKDRIALAKQINSAPELESARQAYAQTYAVEEDVWLAWIEDLNLALPPTEDASFSEAITNAVETARRACEDCLSSSLLAQFSKLTIHAYCAAHALVVPTQDMIDDEDSAMSDGQDGNSSKVDLRELFNLDQVRTTCSEILTRSRKDLANGSEVWEQWRIFETYLLLLEQTPDQLIVVEKLFLDQLSCPHLEIEETFSKFSRFVTRFDNQNYDRSLPAANKVYSTTKMTVDERELQERALARADGSLEAFQAYINWELQVKSPNVDLVHGLLERMITKHLADESGWQFCLNSAKRLRNVALRASLAARAVRAIPEKPYAWLAHMRCAEQLSGGSDVVDEIFAQALATNLFDASVESLVQLYEARAGAHRRELDLILSTSDDQDGELSTIVEAVLQEGLERVRSADEKGDPSMRLEKYLLRIYERFGHADRASSLWQNLAQKRSREYAIWYSWADFETRQGNFTKAHEIFVDGINTKNLDYPEYLIDAWLTFESHNGTLADIEFAESKSARLREAIQRRRQREAMEATAAAAEVSDSANQTDQEAQQVDTQTDQDSNRPGDVPLARSTAESEGKKRANSVDDDNDHASKRAKLSEPLKRDRENSTVFATVDLTASASEHDLKQLFRDCGEIREILTKSVSDKLVANIEFMTADCVPPARTKDKKRINGHEVEVHPSWQSCLYVTNFPADFDKERVEELFRPFGLIFDTRWPSKRFKSTRRFCYVQFVSPSSAQSALSLHGKTFDGEPHALSVQISDPTHRQKRTDADKSELRVGNLSASTTDSDVSKLFSSVGPVKAIRVVRDDAGLCKGLAFVEMENQADVDRALQLNNAELRKKHISVIVADHRQKGTKDNLTDSETFAARAVFVSELAAEVKESDVHQAFAKLGPVKKVVHQPGAGHAVVEYESASTAGQVVLKTGIQVAGHTVRVAPYVSKKGYSKSTSRSADFLPRQAASPMRGRGRGRSRVGIGAKSQKGSSNGPSAKGSAQTPDDFRKLI